MRKSFKLMGWGKYVQGHYRLTQHKTKDNYNYQFHCVHNKQPNADTK